MPGSDTPRLTRVAGRDTFHIYHARRRISTGCTDRAEAQAVLDQYVQSLNRPSSETLTVSALLNRYIETRRDREIPGLARLEWAHKPLKRLMGNKIATAITEAECLSYTRQRVRDGVQLSTARTELQAFRAAARWAAKGGMIAAAPEVTMPPRPPARVRWLTREEAAKLQAECKAGHIKLFVTIALNTAARSGAILGLTWDRVDLDAKLIDFREPGRADTRKRRARVPINDTLHAALTAARAAAISDYVIEWGGDQVQSVKHGIATAARKAGLSDVSPHVFRHTAVTWMLHAGVPIWEVAGYAHMSVEMVQDTYGHHHPDYLRAPARALG